MLLLYNQTRCFAFHEHNLDLYSSPNIIQVIKSRRMGWARNVALIGERRVACRVLVGNLKKRDHLEDTGRDGRIILKMDIQEV